MKLKTLLREHHFKNLQKRVKELKSTFNRMQRKKTYSRDDELWMEEFNNTLELEYQLAIRDITNEKNSVEGSWKNYQILIKKRHSILKSNPDDRVAIGDLEMLEKDAKELKDKYNYLHGELFDMEKEYQKLQRNLKSYGSF